MRLFAISCTGGTGLNPEGALIASTNGGATWSYPAGPNATGAYAIASSADGLTLGALAGPTNNASVVLSYNGGVEWHSTRYKLPQNDWSTITLSADGSTIGVAGGGCGTRLPPKARRSARRSCRVR